jgi:hypothetical protein
VSLKSNISVPKFLIATVVTDLHMDVWGRAVAAVTFFCKLTPWKNSIVLIFESLINISESPLQNIKNKTT